MLKKDPKISLLSVDIAKKKMISSIKNKLKTEYINLEDLENRVLAEDIFSKVNIPEYNNAAVDGFALRSICLRKKINKFRVIGESLPGKPFDKEVKEGESIKIYTGAYLLDNNKTDTIIMEEDCYVKKKLLKLKVQPELFSNIRKKAEDIKKKDKVFCKGTKIRAVDLAQLSSMGLKKVRVYKKLRVSIFSTGNEINKKTKSKYTIYDANKLTLVTMFRKIGCDVKDLGVIEDNLTKTKKKIYSVLKNSDLIVTSGGISSSKVDKIGQTLSKFGKIQFWRLAIKPGRPFAFGSIKDKPFIGLPGNPVAAIVTFFMIVIDYVKKKSGNNVKPIIERVLPANFEMKKKLGRKEWLRGKIEVLNKKQFLTKYPTTGSGIISSISKSDGIIEIDEKKRNIRKGTLLKFFRYEDMLN